MEARRSQFALRTVASNITSDLTEVDGFGKGSKKGKKGKGDVKNGKKEGQHQNQNPNPSQAAVGWHWGKQGHSSTECWSTPWNQSGSSGTQNKRGKGKPKIVTGKGAGSLEQRGQQAAVVEPQSQPALASPLDLASIETDHEGWLRCTYDTAAPISAFPLAETQATDCRYKIASGELISDRGGLRVQGTTEFGYGVTFQGTKADVHKTLISKRKVADSNGGIIPYNSTLARNIQQKEIVNELGAIRLPSREWQYIRYTQIQQQGSTRSNQELCSMHAKQQSGGLRPSQECEFDGNQWVRLITALCAIRTQIKLLKISEKCW